LNLAAVHPAALPASTTLKSSLKRQSVRKTYASAGSADHSSG